MIRKIYFVFITIIVAVVLIAGCVDQSSNPDSGDGETTQIGDLKITSTAFENGGNIPGKYSCDGDDISPPLSFENIPEGAESLVLIVDDPDAPDGTWVHWVVYGLSAETTGFVEDAVFEGYVGLNSWGDEAYGGPCPPIGEIHRYYFRLYALDTELDLHSRATRQEVDAAMSGHILEQTSLMGKYSS